MITSIARKQIKAAQRYYERLKYWNKCKENLESFFNKNTGNGSLEATLIKVVLIDSLYWTQLSKHIRLIEMAEYIVQNWVKFEECIEAGETTAVEMIQYCKMPKKSGRGFLSFASKFCHFHNPGRYPIYDQYAILALSQLNRKFPNGISDYARFRRAIEDKMSQGTSFKETDIFLWLLGMKIALENSKGKTVRVNKEVMALYKADKFKKLLRF